MAMFDVILSVKPNGVSKPLNNAYLEWKNTSAFDGKKYIWFEHHAEIYFGIKGTIDYTRRIFDIEKIIDEEKYLMFVLKYS